MTQDPDPLDIGDPLPNLILPDAKGAGIGLSQQQRAGRWQVILFLEADDIPARSEAIAAARERLGTIEGLLFVTALAVPDETLATDLFDESRKAAKYLTGSVGRGIAVISPMGQLAAQFSDLELDQAVAFCEGKFSAQSPTVVTGTAPALVIENILSQDLCKDVMAFWKNNPKQSGTVASNKQGNEAAITSIKRREDVVVPDGPLFEQVKMAIGRKVLPLMERSFRTRVASMEALRIGAYHAKDEGAFGRHRDNTTEHTAHRRFALTLNLNTGNYDGGELRFPEFGRSLYAPPAGSGVVFSCSLLHEALPVTNGTRMGMFTFFTDAEGLQMEKARQQKQQMQA